MSHFSKAHVLWLSLGVSTLGVAFAKSVPPRSTPPPPVSVTSYRTELQLTINQLKQLENKPTRRITPILQTLSNPRAVRRSDGKIQSVSGSEWSRWAQPSNTSATRSEVKRLRSAVELRLRALDAWSMSTYAPADAQAIMRQLEGSGQIRTGPTWWQQKIADFNKWWRTAWQKLMRWLEGLFPSAAPQKLPSIDPLWIKLFFYCTVFALLSLLAYLVWRAVGGRIGKQGTKRGVFAEGEDAALLLLPPDELRERAHRFADAGDYREALRHLYISLMLTLDARGVWRYDARRTNWEHIRALRNDPAQTNIVAPLSGVTRVFDRVRYGNADFQREEWLWFEQEVIKLGI
jgi:hypothetical protein